MSNAHFFSVALSLTFVGQFISAGIISNGIEAFDAPWAEFQQQEGKGTKIHIP
jgi:hypothetical protein